MPPGKTRITIRIDDDILEWFRRQVHEAGGGSYQTLVNSALRSFIESQDRYLEDTLRRVLREEVGCWPKPPLNPTTAFGNRGLEQGVRCS